jgi:hypothetical protein
MIELASVPWRLVVGKKNPPGSGSSLTQDMNIEGSLFSIDRLLNGMAGIVALGELAGVFMIMGSVYRTLPVLCSKVGCPRRGRRRFFPFLRHPIGRRVR